MCPCWVCWLSSSLRPLSSPVLLLGGPGACGLVGDASPVSSVNSCSFGQGGVGSWSSMPSSVKTDLRPLVMLVDREKDGGLPEPSRIRSSVHRWWNRGLAERPEGVSGAGEGLGRWVDGMMTDNSTLGCQDTATGTDRRVCTHKGCLGTAGGCHRPGRRVGRGPARNKQ